MYEMTIEEVCVRLRKDIVEFDAQLADLDRRRRILSEEDRFPQHLREEFACTQARLDGYRCHARSMLQMITRELWG